MKKEKKSLKEMSLEELWQLFPISLVPYNPDWKSWGLEEINLLHEMLSEYNPIITHIGSTAIPTILAKPIIDILVEIPYSEQWGEIIEKLEARGYILMNRSNKRLSFNKGYTPDGYAERVYHIHIHDIGDNDEIIFRDYLISHPKAADEYERLKQSLLSKYWNNRDRYTDAKTDFVKKIIGCSV